VTRCGIREESLTKLLGKKVASVKEFFRGIKRSIIGSLALLAFDAGFCGSILMSWIFCPIWFLVSLLKNAIQRPGWGLALVRIGIPVLTLGIVKANSDFQLTVAETNAQRVVAACETYRAANGEYPERLQDLVPQYLNSVPVAKHCLGPSRIFYYFSDKPLLVWYVVPPYLRKIYDFETRSWSYLD
jgi:hypothetical protein